ncbi:MAG TPA: tetratricopeptide repeat protein [Candidatus Sulfotelmatobacter sp.]|nr:tetratricopeptide repeat protein [Candidatus Sulfotelmatobacter sp.]
MKKLIALLALSLGAVAFAQTPVAETSALSPAEKSIAAARKEIANKPAQFGGYNHLAIALSRRARETSDVAYYAQAEDALKKSLELAPNDFESQKISVWLLLGRHEFPGALEAAKALNKKVPDDVLVYGFLTDANAELGNYDDAEKAAQWMLNLRPGNLPGMTRAAYLRELFGDVDGAYELMDMAYQSTVPTETEDRAWILAQMGHLRFIAGRTDDAENILQQALTIFPGYHYALGNLARVRIAQKRYDDAVILLQQRYQAAPHAENLYDLAEALELAGRTSDAKKAFAEFETKSLAESTRKDNSSRELGFYYADHAKEPAKALAIAQQEFAWRHDIYTLDAYAWALHANGRDAEARKQLDTALRVGIRDATLFAHAGEIALKLGDRAEAERYLRQSVSLHATGSEQARLLLAGFGKSQVTE